MSDELDTTHMPSTKNATETTQPVNAVAFSRDGTGIAFDLDDKTVWESLCDPQ